MLFCGSCKWIFSEQLRAKFRQNLKSFSFALLLDCTNSASTGPQAVFANQFTNLGQTCRFVACNHINSLEIIFHEILFSFLGDTPTLNLIASHLDQYLMLALAYGYYTVSVYIQSEFSMLIFGSYFCYFCVLKLT